MACCGWGSTVRQPPGLPWQWITPWAASSLDASGQAESKLFEYTVAEIQQKLISCYYLLGTVLGTGHWGDGTEMKFAPIFSLFLFIFIFLIFKIFIVIQLQLSAFSPHPSTPPQPNPPPSPASTLPLDFVHVSFIVVPVNPSPHCPLPTTPSPLPSVCC